MMGRSEDGRNGQSGPRDCSLAAKPRAALLLRVRNSSKLPGFGL